MSDFEKRNEWEKEPLQEKQLNLSEDDFSEKKQ